MHRKVAILALALLSSVFLLGQISPVNGQEEEIQRVLVTNFPDLQQVAGTVSVEGPCDGRRTSSTPASSASSGTLSR